MVDVFAAMKSVTLSIHGPSRVQYFIADVHPAVGAWLRDLILILGEACFLHTESLQHQTARSQVVRVDTLAKEHS